MKNENKNKLDLLKKYWFVGLVCIGLIVFICLYIVDYEKSKPQTIETKEIDGQYVVFDIDGQNYLADELYEDLYKIDGISCEYNKFTEMVLDKAYKTTSDISSKATILASNYVAAYGEEAIGQDLISMGYPNGINDLSKYCESYFKNLQLIRDFYTEHYDEYVPSFLTDSNYKVVSHILVKVANVTETTDADGNTAHTANPSAEEQAKLDEVLEALKTKSFEDVAKEYSEDGSAADGGYLGIYSDESAASTFVAEFANAVKTTSIGSVSDPFVSEYGYHIVKIEEATKEKILEDDQTMINLNNNYQENYLPMILAKANELGFTISDKLQEQIDKQIAANEEGSEE